MAGSGSTSRSRKRTYTADEAIEGLATLSVLGPGVGKIGASGGGPIMLRHRRGRWSTRDGTGVDR